MATTLANLRAKLNGEIGVDADADTLPWSTTVRNNAISDAYAELWRVGVWKPATQSISTTNTTWIYALTSMRAVYRVEVLDTSNYIIDQYPATVEDDGSGGYQLVLPVPTATGFTLRVRGWQPYVSTFANDSASDDLPSEYNRIPLLKAKAILWRQQLARFIRYGERQNVPPEMNVTVDQLLAAIAAAEREFEVEAKRLANRRQRVMYPSRALTLNG